MWGPKSSSPLLGLVLRWWWTLKLATNAVFEFISEWQEYLEIEATPALEDHEAGLIVGSLYGQDLG